LLLKRIESNVITILGPSLFAFVVARCVGQ